jgi:hypothetical protein
VCIAGALLKAKPNVVIGLTDAGGSYTVALERFNAWKRMMLRVVPSLKCAWIQEINEDGCRSHLHVYGHLATEERLLLTSSLVQEKATKAGFGLTDLRRAEPKTLTYAGYPFKQVLTDLPGLVALNSANGQATFIHAMRGFWRDASTGRIFRSRAEAEGRRGTRKGRSRQGDGLLEAHIREMGGPWPGVGPAVAIDAH